MTRSSGPLHDALMGFAQAVVAGDAATASRLLAASPDLASACLEEGAARHGPEGYFLDEIKHYLYAGDTALHVAAAAYRDEIARKLIAAGANVRARNRSGRRSQCRGQERRDAVAPGGTHALRGGSEGPSRWWRRCPMQEQQRFDADADRDTNYRPRRQRLAGGQSATSTDRAPAGAARRVVRMTCGPCSKVAVIASQRIARMRAR
jgi:hypothetical protein